VKRNKNKCYIRESIDEELMNRTFNSVKVDLVNQPFSFCEKIMLGLFGKISLKVTLRHLLYYRK